MLIAEIDAGWRTARQASSRPVASNWERMPERNAALASAWDCGRPAEREAGSDWSGVPALDQSLIEKWTPATPRDSAAVESGFAQFPPKDLGVIGAWGHSIR